MTPSYWDSVSQRFRAKIRHGKDCGEQKYGSPCICDVEEIESVLKAELHAMRNLTIEECVGVVPAATTSEDIEPQGAMCLEFADGWDEHNHKTLIALAKMKKPL